MATIVIVIMTAAMFFGDISFASEQTEMPEPEVAYEYETSGDGNDRLRIRHVEGPRVNPQQFAVRVEGASCAGPMDPNGEYGVHQDFGLSEDNWYSPNMALIIDDDNPVQMCENGGFSLSGATVTLLWENPEGEYQTMDRWSN